MIPAIKETRKQDKQQNQIQQQALTTTPTHCLHFF